MRECFVAIDPHIQIDIYVCIYNLSHCVCRITMLQIMKHTPTTIIITEKKTEKNRAMLLYRPDARAELLCVLE